MTRTYPLLATLLVSVTLSAGARAADSSAIGRYQLGGTERDGLILLDTATGRTWKYSRDARDADRDAVWIPLRHPQKTNPPSGVPTGEPVSSRQAGEEQPWVSPGPYQNRRPGGK